jgi:hypothetical protein
MAVDGQLEIKWRDAALWGIRIGKSTGPADLRLIPVTSGQVISRRQGRVQGLG